MVVSVAMVVGVFVLTDRFAPASTAWPRTSSGAELAVRSPLEIGEEFDRPTVPESVDAVVAGVDGVARTIPGVISFNDVVIIDGEGEAIRPQGPPAIVPPAPLQFFIIEGEEPTTAGTFATDVTTAGDNGLRIGETYAIDGPQQQERFELVGIFRFGSPDEHTSLGQTMVMFELEEAQRFFGKEDGYDQIDVIVEAGADIASVQADIQAAVGSGWRSSPPKSLRRRTPRASTRSSRSSTTSCWSAIVIIVFVATFIINNTFQIVVAQRIRELGLCAIGATGQQVSRSVYLEALLVGIFSTVSGILLGLLLGTGLRGLLNTVGFSLPAGPLCSHRAPLCGRSQSVSASRCCRRSCRPAGPARSPIAAIQSDQRLAGRV